MNITSGMYIVCLGEKEGAQMTAAGVYNEKNKPHLRC